MSKFVKVMIVLLTIAAMATPVIAADNLSLSGSMRVRGAHLDDGDDSITKVDQRLRVGGTFTATENISLTFRTDFSEGQWGSDNGYGHFDTIKDMDRAHLDITTDSYDFRAGTQYWGLGSMYAFDHNGTGATLTIKGNIPVTLLYSLVDNNDTAEIDSGDGYYDETLTPKLGGTAATNSSDDFAVGVATSVAGFDFYAALYSASVTEITLLGATYKADYDGIKVVAALDYFTGDVAGSAAVPVSAIEPVAIAAVPETDAMGLQAMLDVSMAASEAATIGGRIFYALGADDDETQISYLGNGFGGYDPLNYGPYENENLQNITRPADAFGDAGVMALQLYTDYKASDALNFTGSVVYAQPEDDDVSTGGDDAMFLNAGMAYALMQNATIKSQFQYVDYDANSDENISVGLGLWVNF